MSGIIRMIGRAYTSTVFAICNTKFVQNFVLQAKNNTEA